MIQFTKRELTLVDQSGFSVRLTLFGKQAEEYVQEANSVVAFKGVRVSEFGGMFKNYAFPNLILTKN